jgi:class 3 adenylate cyclase
MRYGKLPKALVIEWEIDVNVPLKDVWYFASNTDKINQAIGSGAVEYREEPNPKGGSFLYGKTSNSGIISEYREYPYEWIENCCVSVYREYSKGPVKKMIFESQFTENEKGFCVKFILQFELSSIIYKPFVIWEAKKNAIPRFKKAFAQLEEFGKGKSQIPFPTHGFIPLSSDPERFQELYQKFSYLKGEEDLKKKIAKFLLDTPGPELVKIKPYVVAKNINASKKNVLEFFLRLTREGFMDMNWDLLCPSCRGPKSSSHHLSELQQEVHCPTCNIDYSGEFDKSVELTFTPTEKIRKVEGAVFCFGGPGNTPHFKIQWRVLPKKVEKLSYTLEEGTYRIYSLQRKESILIDVKKEYPIVNSISYPSNQEKIESSPGKVELILSHDDSEEILVRLEKTAWLDDVATAFEVTSFQEFRDLFSFEALRPGQEIAVKNIAILFTDLKGSTKFYNEKGDAYAYKIVSDHFDILMQKARELDGAIVKTIGDAVMAIFTNPVQSLLYAISIHKEIKNLNSKNGNPESISLKVGIHIGPAIAVTMNEKLDYFGSTVNLAARTEGQCNGNDIVITKQLFDYPGIQEELEKANLTFEHFFANVKGFSDSYPMVRINL